MEWISVSLCGSCWPRRPSSSPSFHESHSTLHTGTHARGGKPKHQKRSAEDTYDKSKNGQSDQPSFFGRGHPYSGHVLRHRIHLSWLLGLRQGELHLRTGLRTHPRRVHESFRERLCGENRLSRVRTPTRTRRIQLLGMPDNAIPTRAAHHPPRGFANLGRRRRRVDASRPVADSLRRTTGRTRSREISHRDRIALATSGD